LRLFLAGSGQLVRVADKKRRVAIVDRYWWDLAQRVSSWLGPGPPAAVGNSRSRLELAVVAGLEDEILST